MTKIKYPDVFQAILEGLHIGVCLVDREHRIVFWNEGAERITGIPKQEVLGHCHMDSLITRQDGACGTCELDMAHPVVRVLNDGQRITIEGAIQHKLGHHVPVRLFAGPIRDERGAIIGAAESFDEVLASSERNWRQSFLAAHDVLDETTGVACYRFVETQLQEHLAVFESYPIPFSVLCIQIDGMDHFKSALGAGAAPIILHAVAQSIENCIRPNDCLGRWVDDRFICILAECPAPQLTSVARRLQASIHHDEIRWWGEHFSVSISMGGTTARSGDTSLTLLERAERSLLESAKSGGTLLTEMA